MTHNESQLFLLNLAESFQAESRALNAKGQETENVELLKHYALTSLMCLSLSSALMATYDRRKQPS